MRYLGEHREMEGLIYPDFEKVITDDRSIPEEWEKAGGLDFGWTQPFATIAGASDFNGVLWVYDIHCEARMLLKEHLTRIPHIRYRADPEARQEIEELQAISGNYPGLEVEPAAMRDVSIGIEKVTARIRQNRLKILRSCSYDIVDEAATYRTDERGRIVKANDHRLDALRYLIASLDDVAGEPEIVAVQVARENRMSKWLSPFNDEIFA